MIYGRYRKLNYHAWNAWHHRYQLGLGYFDGMAIEIVFVCLFAFFWSVFWLVGYKYFYLFIVVPITGIGGRLWSIWVSFVTLSFCCAANVLLAYSNKFFFVNCFPSGIVLWANAIGFYLNCCGDNLRNC